MSLAHYYAKGKAGLMGINTGEAVQHGEDLLIAGGTGLVLGAISASIGGLDHSVAGMKVPVDGMASVGLALAGLAMRSPELKVASVAAGGSASTRWFESFFKKSLGAHGDFDGSDIPFGYGYGHELPAYGGRSAESRLAAFAEAL
jgi:hypothetical protein